MAEDKHQALLEKIERLLSEEEPERLVFFSKDEEKALKAIIQRERAWQAIGMLAGSARSIMTWIGIAIATWAAMKAGLLEWLKSNL